MNSFQHSQPPPGSSSSSNMRLAFTPDGNAIYKSVMAAAAAAAAAAPTYQGGGGGGGGGGCGDNNNNSSGGGGGGGGGSNSINALNMNIGEEPMKRKRGRPRKYGPDGTMALGLTPTVAVTAAVPVPVPPPPIQIPTVVGGGGFSPSSGGGGGGGVSPSSSSSMKKARGRPPGSGKKKQRQQMDALGGSGGIGFTPHVIAVKAGEDISSKIMSFSQHVSRAVCILSANGAISNVTLRQAATSGGTVTYEGRFEILSLTGSFLLSESGGQRSRTGGLSVSLAGPDGRVLGGGVAGILTAASPVQVVVGSFIVDGALKEIKLSPLEPCSSAPLAPSKVTAGGGVAGGASSPTSRGTMSESSGGPGSPLNQSTGACNNNNNNMQGMANMPWK